MYSLLSVLTHGLMFNPRHQRNIECRSPFVFVCFRFAHFSSRFFYPCLVLSTQHPFKAFTRISKTIERILRIKYSSLQSASRKRSCVYSVGSDRSNVISKPPRSDAQAPRKAKDDADEERRERSRRIARPKRSRKWHTVLKIMGEITEFRVLDDRPGDRLRGADSQDPSHVRIGQAGQESDFSHLVRRATGTDVAAARWYPSHHQSRGVRHDVLQSDRLAHYRLRTSREDYRWKMSRYPSPATIRATERLERTQPERT
ncbi:unnamed protein product [Xylocopa violacea]|uniref:Uncharacterized protein n=1 Tax=Xylocopa violacea TaxID=135666 RepID=A0ABP1NH53_XYLVO